MKYSLLPTEQVNVRNQSHAEKTGIQRKGLIINWIEKYDLCPVAFSREEETY